MGRPRNPLLGKTAADNKPLPKPKRKKRPKGSKGNGWALVGIAASLAAWAFAAFRLGRSKHTKRTTDRDLLRNMLSKPLMITEHAACRMECRHVTQSEVQEALRDGRINAKKSNPAELPCPKYVVDAKVGRTEKNVQAVMSACPYATKLVTVIDKDYAWECYCP